MKLVFYLDESGNSGDAIPKNTTNPFSGQPSFALSRSALKNQSM